MLKKNNITIESDEYWIKILITKNSDLSLVYNLLKTFCNWNEIIPQSIYVIRSDNTKIKKSINMFRNFNLWDFLDRSYEIDHGIILNSSEQTLVNVIGWEIRYALDVEKTEIETKTHQGIDRYIKSIDKLKKSSNDF